MCQIEKLRNEIKQTMARVNKRLADMHCLGIPDNVEQWRLISGYNNYEVSSHGRVRNNISDKVLKLCENKGGYFKVTLYKDGKKQTRVVHKLVAEAFIDNPNDKQYVDHIDNDRKNNYKSNLRWCSSQENNRNRTKKLNTSSKYRGVYWHKRFKKWHARIKTNGVNKHIGYFDDEESAARAYDVEAKRIDPVFYKMNFPE